MFSTTTATSTITRSLLPSIRTSTLRQQPTFHRSFHASAANMVKNVYFDVQWTGPEAQVDSNGKITSLDKAEKRTL